MANATSYRLWVDDASTTDPKIQSDYTPAQAGCTTAGAVCHVSPGVILAAGRASWSVRASNAAGAGPWSGALDFTVPDGKVPSIAIATPTSATTFSTGSATIALGGTATDDVAVTQVTWTNDRGGSGTASGTSSWTIPSIALSGGANVITVTARDGAGNTGTDVLTVTKTDGQAPTIDLTAPTSGSAYSTASSSISLGGTASDDSGVIRITWSSDRGGSGSGSISTDMTSGGTAAAWSVQSIALQPGVNNLTVRAFDAAGNQSSRALVVTLSDTVAPTVSITTPSGTYSTGNEAVTVSGVAADAFGVTQVSWSNNQGGTGTASGTTAWSASIALKPGANVITVTAKDAAGNASNASVTVTLTDGTAPSISIASPTAATTFTTTMATLALGGTASDAFGVTQVSWSTDKGASGAASGSAAWNVASIPLEVGSTVITVTARDAAGNTGTDVLTVTRTDGVPPTVDITAPATGATFSTTSTTIAIAGTASDNVGVSQVSWSNNKGGSGVATGTTSWSVASVSLQPGANVITVTAKDAAGNLATDVLTVTVTDAVAPTIAITTPTGAETLKTTSASVTLGGTASDLFGVTEVRWNNDRGGSGVAVGTNSWSAVVALQQGVNVVTVTAADAAGNTSTDRITVTSDSKAPTIALVQPTSGATYVTKGESVSLSGTATDEVGVTEVSWSNNRGGTGLASGTTSWSATSVALQSGVNVLTITARDAAGNSSNVTLSVTRDSQAPTVSIVAPTTGATFVTNKASIALGGKAADNTAVTRVSWRSNRGGQGNANGTSDWSVAAIPLQAGANVISVTALDGAGNEITSTLTVTLDTRAPVVSIQAPAGNGVVQTTESSAAFGGVASDDTGIAEVTWSNSVGGSGVATGTTAWNARVPLTAGFNELTVTVKDLAGNTATASVRLKVTDKTAPKVRITGPSMEPATSVSTNVINVEGTASDDFGVSQIAWANSRGGSGMVRVGEHWVVGGVVLQPGVNVIAVTAVDASGNSGSSETRVTYDRALPTLSITSPSSTGTYASPTATVAVAGIASDDTGISQVSWTTDKGQIGVASGTTAWSIPSVTVDGATVLTVKATDKSGNSTSATLLLSRSDLSAPSVKIYTPTTAASYTTTAGSLVLGGTASDNVAVTQLTWSNGNASGDSFGTTGWSTPAVPLVVGTNVITVKATDAAGNTGTATLTVTRTAVTSQKSQSSPSDPSMGAVSSDPNQARPSATAPSPAPSQTPTPTPTTYTAPSMPVSIPQALPTPQLPTAPPPAPSPAPAPAPKTIDRAPASTNGTKDDSNAPVVVRITSPTTARKYSTKTSSLAIAGTASHPSGIVIVKWSTDRGDDGVAQGTLSWNIATLPLKSGTTTITVTAVAESGDTTTATLVVQRPDELPKVNVTSPTADSQWVTSTGTVALRGAATDNVTRVMWSADSGASGYASGTTSWATAGIPLQEGVNRITLTAYDAGGRADRHVLTITYRPRVSSARAGTPNP